MPKITASRYHDISCGHRVVGHEGKCRHLHGHNYRVHFNCQSTELDSVGRVVDFSVIKEKLCMWLEENWDHKFLAWDEDELITELPNLFLGKAIHVDDLIDSFVFVPFNPTAENMAKYLVDVVAPEQLRNTNVTLTKVVIEETRKCSVEYSL